MITGVDHIVLRVEDVERSLAWYCGVLGLAPERVDEWRAGEVPFPSARVNETFVIDIFPLGDGRLEFETRNVDHVCLVVAGDVTAFAEARGLEPVAGPASRWGAQGDATSVYVLDPDANVVELRSY